MRGALYQALEAPQADRTAGGHGLILADAMDIRPDEVGFGRFGHGIGLHVPEPPSLHAADPTPVVPGMTLCFEPTAVHAGVNFVVEEEYLVTGDGSEPLLPRSPDGILSI